MTLKLPTVKGTRGRVEGALRTHGRLAPKFFCCHCGRFRQTLFHLANCGRKKGDSAARLKRIRRCEEEIRHLESLPPDIPDKAYLVTMGVEDWRAEKRLEEGEF